MKFKFLFFLTIINLIIKTKLSETIAVFEIFRHGARQPMSMESIIEQILYGVGSLQLTPNGFKQHLLLGKIFKNIKYKEFISRVPKLNFFSSPRQRCIYSASGQILGMFPNSHINYISENQSFDIREDDVPPGFSSLLKNENNKRKVINRKFLASNDIKNNKDENNDNLSGITVMQKAVNLTIVDPLKDGMFHPDKCGYIGNSINSSYSKSVLYIEESAEEDESGISKKLNSNKNSNKSKDSISEVEDILNSQENTIIKEENNINNLNSSILESIDSDMESIIAESNLQKRNKIKRIKNSDKRSNMTDNQIKNLNKKHRFKSLSSTHNIKKHSDSNIKKIIQNPPILKTLLKKTQIFNFTSEEITTAVDKIITSLSEAFKNRNITWSWPFSSPSEKYSLQTLKKLTRFLLPLRYHFKGKTKTILFYDSVTETIIKKIMINVFYETKLVNDFNHRLLFSNIMSDILDKIRSNEKSFNMYSGHDTNIVNFITNLFDISELKNRISTAADEGNDSEFEFFVPPFASSIIFELYSFNSDNTNDGETKNIYVKVFYNNKEMVDNWVKGINYIKGKGIEVDNFIKVFGDLVVNTKLGKWVCSGKDD